MPNKLIKKLQVYRNAFGARGIWLALRTKMTHASRTELAALPGSTYRVEVRLNGPELETFSKIFFHHDYEIPLGKTPAFIIDAGANVGYASIYFAIAFPNAKILAIEPEASNFEILKRNTAPFPNIIAVKGALWPSSGQVDLLDPGMGTWGFEAAESSTIDVNRSKIDSVRAYTVTELTSAYNFPRVDILKIDIEGGEKTLFAGSPEWLRQVNAIMIELHDGRNLGCSRNFYIATRDFAAEFRKGENVFMLRQEYLPSNVSR